MPFSELRQRLEQSRYYDWTMRAALIAYSLFVLFFDVVVFLNQVLARPSPLGTPDSGVVMTVLARVCQWMFIALFAILPVFRLRPIAKSARILPRLAPLAAIVLSPMFLFLERAPSNLAVNFISVALSLVAAAMAVVTLTFLGRSFSIMPEARRLVTDGPYKMVRHPLYLCEVAIVFAMFVQYRSAAAAVLFILIAGVEVARAIYEEAVLARAFPEFEAYRRSTNFLLPRNPIRFFALFVADRAARRRLAAVVICALGLLELVMALPRLV
ncbi:MAG: isoprenylcysteine carboxylmethyltransferase family protein [Pseudolabrys sp.]